MLGWIPEFDFEIVDAGCCGMSGSFGMESEHYAASQAMGELALLPAVRGAGPDAAVIANGFSCRHQIHDGTGRQAEHIAQDPQQRHIRCNVNLLRLSVDD